MTRLSVAALIVGEEADLRVAVALVGRTASTSVVLLAEPLPWPRATSEVVPMFKYLLGLAAIAALIAFGVDKLQERGTKAGPTVVTVNVPNPMGGGGGGGNPIYVP